MELKKFKLGFLGFTKQQFADAIVLYTTTLIITLGMLYLLFPSLVTGLTEVRTVNKNVSVVNEKIDTLNSNQNYLHEKLDVVIENQYNFTGSILDSMRILNQKVEILRGAVYQGNRLSLQNSRDLQTLKQLNYNQSSTQQSQPTIQSLDGLFRKSK